MTMLTVNVPDDVKALAEARAAEAGCSDVGEYLVQLIKGDAAGGPAGLSVDSDDDVEAMLLARLDGPSVEVDAADFQHMRDRLKARLGGSTQPGLAACPRPMPIPRAARGPA
jgi:hypothetical protein